MLNKKILTMPDDSRKHLVMEILHRLETNDIVNLEELIYLHNQAEKHPDVKRWVNKLLYAESSYMERIDKIA